MCDVRNTGVVERKRSGLGGEELILYTQTHSHAYIYVDIYVYRSLYICWGVCVFEYVWA